MAHLIDILIPSLVDRRSKLERLMDAFDLQIKDNPVNVISLTDNRESTTGAKRNKLLQMATSDYVCFFDDDDTPSYNYIDWIVKAAKSGMDCASLIGSIELMPGMWRPFYHSRTVTQWYEFDGKYFRYPNHLNLIKREIATQISFPDKTIGEDHVWSTALYESGLIKTEFEIPDTIYYYNYSK